MPGPLIALTTDFGSGSAYVLQMKGVLVSAVPDARIVDVSHDLPPQDIRQAELLLRGTAFALPLGAVHVVVIDPGVGTERRPIAVHARGMTFVGPDNGVLGGPLAQPDARAVVLDREELFRRPLSATFHGRDIFAPVAAELAAGLTLEDVGHPIDDPIPSSLPAPRPSQAGWDGDILGPDRFGNLLTNLPRRQLAEDFEVRRQGQALPVVRTYGEAPEDTLVALEGSDGYLELAVRNGSAAEHLGHQGGAIWAGPGRNG